MIFFLPLKAIMSRGIKKKKFTSDFLCAPPPFLTNEPLPEHKTMHHGAYSVNKPCLHYLPKLTPVFAITVASPKSTYVWYIRV